MENNCRSQFPALQKSDFKQQYPLAQLTTLDIGGPAEYFIRADSIEKLVGAVKFAERSNLPWTLIGGGSNLLISDDGIDGVVIQNKIQRFDELDANEYFVGAGNNLWKSIDKFIARGSGGMEKMSAIPGDIAGAVYGNAGAYGQEIKDSVKLVAYYDVEKDEFNGLSNEKCEFDYRHSRFKDNKQWIITGVKFQLESADKEDIKQSAQKIVDIRADKYPQDLACPGSFFKNVFYEDLPEKAKQEIDQEKVRAGKVSAGYLIDECGLRGAEIGNVKIYDRHGNIFINKGGASTKEFLGLARRAKKAVKDKFNIELEPEVQLLGNIEL